MKNFVKIGALASLLLTANAVQAQESATWLFVLTGTAGQASGNALTVTEGDATVFGFTDRPMRNHSMTTTDEFVTLWATDGDFAGSNPNAVLTYVVDGQPVEVEIVIDSAEATGSALTFGFQPVVGEIPAEFGPFSIFVDGTTIKVGTCSGLCLY